MAENDLAMTFSMEVTPTIVDLAVTTQITPEIIDSVTVTSVSEIMVDSEQVDVVYAEDVTVAEGEDGDATST